jgi:hypothetical protein
MRGLPAVVSEQLAEEALGAAVRDRCGGGSWRGVARGLAWRVVAVGEWSPQSIELLAETAEKLFVLLIDDALWSVEQVVSQSWKEYLAACPRDTDGALKAARLDASEESRLLVEAVCERVLASLLAVGQRAA